MSERVNLEALEEQFTRALEDVGTIGKDAIKAGIPLIAECSELREHIDELTTQLEESVGVCLEQRKGNRRKYAQMVGRAARSIYDRTPWPNLTLERDDARTAYRDMKAVLRLTVDERDTARLAAETSVAYAKGLEAQLATAKPVVDAVGNAILAHPLMFRDTSISLRKVSITYHAYLAYLAAQSSLPSDEPEAVAMVKCPGSPCFGGEIRCGKEGEYFEDCPTCKGQSVVALEGDDNG